MKIIGRADHEGYIVALSREEIDALVVRRDDYRDLNVGQEIDVISRLRPTVKFEQNALAGPAMVFRLREMADELEAGLAALRAA